MQGPPRIVLSGGIGSGKSTVLGILAGLGARVVSADEIGHQVIAPGGAAAAEVAEEFPEVVVDGVIDRSRLAAIVFSDHAKLRRLERLTHPAIAARILREAADVPGPVVVELPLDRDILGEGWARVVVDVSDEIRMERLLTRGMTEEEIARRMAAQPTRAEWLESADHVVDNGGDLEQLRAEVIRVWGEATGIPPV